MPGEKQTENLSLGGGFDRTEQAADLVGGP